MKKAEWILYFKLFVGSKRNLIHHLRVMSNKIMRFVFLMANLRFDLVMDSEIKTSNE
jgi:hypothetical protein